MIWPTRPAGSGRPAFIRASSLCIQAYASASSSLVAPVAMICATTVSSAGLRTATTSLRVRAAMITSCLVHRSLDPQRGLLGPSTEEWVPLNSVPEAMSQHGRRAALVGVVFAGLSGPSDRCSTALNAVRLDLNRTERAGSHQDRRCPITADLHPRREKIDGIQDL